jgi:hypothetical protein
MRRFIFVLMMFVVSNAANANLITNGEFDVDLSSWTCETGSSCGIQSSFPGTAYIFNNVEVGMISQMISTQAGLQYSIMFDWFSNGNENIGGFSINGVDTTFSTGPIDLTPQAYVASFTATGTSTEFGLLAFTGEGFGTLQYDNVSVFESVAVSAPASIALVSLAVAGFGFVRRK